MNSEHDHLTDVGRSLARSLLLDALGSPTKPAATNTTRDSRGAGETPVRNAELDLGVTHGDTGLDVDSQERPLSSGLRSARRAARSQASAPPAAQAGHHPDDADSIAATEALVPRTPAQTATVSRPASSEPLEVNNLDPLTTPPIRRRRPRSTAAESEFDLGGTLYPEFGEAAPVFDDFDDSPTSSVLATPSPRPQAEPEPPSPAPPAPAPAPQAQRPAPPAPAPAPQAQRPAPAPAPQNQRPAPRDQPSAMGSGLATTPLPARAPSAAPVRVSAPAPRPEAVPAAQPRPARAPAPAPARTAADGNTSESNPPASSGAGEIIERSREVGFAAKLFESLPWDDSPTDDSGSTQERRLRRRGRTARSGVDDGTSRVTDAAHEAAQPAAETDRASSQPKQVIDVTQRSQDATLLHHPDRSARPRHRKGTRTGPGGSSGAQLRTPSTPETEAAQSPASRRTALRSKHTKDTKQHQEVEGELARDGRMKRWLIEWGLVLTCAAAAALILKLVVIGTFYIPSASMYPTLKPEDKVFANKLAYTIGGGVERGDIIVFATPGSATAEEGGEAKHLIKRVIGLPGDIIEARNGVVYINGKPLDETGSDKYLTADVVTNNLPEPITVPPNHVFVMGDNREHSRDSRFFGAVHEDSIVGRAFVLFWPLDRFGFL